jgi:hypothetical protein
MGEIVSLDAWRRDRVWRPDEEPIASRRPACYDEAMPANTDLRPPREAFVVHHSDPAFPTIRLNLTLNVPVPRTHDRVTHHFAVAQLDDRGRVVRAFRREFKGEAEARSAFDAAAADPFVAAGHLSGWADA